MPAIQILIDTDPKDNTTTVDAWAIGADGKPLPIAQSYEQLVNDPSCGAVARVMLQAAAPIFTGGEPVRSGPGIPPEVLA